MKWALGLVLGLAAAAHAETPAPFARVDGTRILGTDGKPLLLRGMNLGNWLVPEGYMFRFEKGPQSAAQIEELFRDLVGPEAARAFWKQWRDTYVTRDDIQYLKRIGLNSVRVPFHYRVLASDGEPVVWHEDGFALLDRVIAWSREAGLYVILDMHCAPGGQTGANIDDSHGYPWLFEDAAAQARTIEVWKKLAERYRNEPAVLGYDLLNEPIPHWEGLDRYNPSLEPLYKRIVAAVRAVDPNHVIFLGGARWNTNFTVFGPPFDANSVYTFHKYWNETNDASIQPFLDFRAKHEVPLWLGESGENTDEWIAACIKLLEGHDIGWAFWPYKKIDATSSIVSIARPPYWDEVVAYAAARTYDFEANYKLRPPLEHGRAALAGLLENIRFARTRINRGYVKALGMTPGVAAPDCAVTNLMPEFWSFWAEAKELPAARQAELFRARLHGPHRDVYDAILAKMPMPEDELVPKALEKSKPFEARMRSLSDQLATDLPKELEHFRATFPGFQCAKPVYVLFSAGAFDGAVRTVAGTRSLMFGLDVAARTQGPRLGPLVVHELFHVHHQAVVPDSPDAFYWALWSEGLATYVSRQLNPAVAETEVCCLPALPETQAALPRLVPEALRLLDSESPADYARYFLGSSNLDIPQRSGYYLGYRVAAEAGRTLSLAELARLKPEAVRKLVVDTLPTLTER